MKPTSRLRAPSVTAALLALALATAWAQGTGSAGTGTGTGSGGGSAGSAAPTAPTAQSGTGTRNTSQSGQKVERADRRFIEDAAASGMFELQAAQLAATKATDRAVKDYASMMADHHSAANKELMQMANSKGLELPAAPTRAMRRELEHLGKKTGSEFDREFVRKVGIDEHQRDVKRFQKASNDVKDPQLKAWIDKTLPSLEQHLAQAQKLPQAEKSASRSDKSGTSTSGAGPQGPGTGSSSQGGSGGGNRTGN